MNITNYAIISITSLLAVSCATKQRLVSPQEVVNEGYTRLIDKHAQHRVVAHDLVKKWLQEEKKSPHHLSLQAHGGFTQVYDFEIIGPKKGYFIAKVNGWNDNTFVKRRVRYLYFTFKTSDDPINDMSMEIDGVTSTTYSPKFAKKRPEIIASKPEPWLKTY